MKDLTQEKLTRRRLLKNTVGTGAGAAAAGALGGYALPSSAKASRQEAPLGAEAVPMAAGGNLPEQELRIGIFQSPHAEAVRRLAPRFTELTGGNVTVQVDSSPTEVIDPRKLAMWQAGGDDWDVVWISNGGFLQIQGAGFTVPLSDYMKPEWIEPEVFNVGDWPQALLDTYSYEGQIHGLPFESSAYMQFVLTDLLEEHAGDQAKLPPLEGYSWEELIEIAQTVQESINSKGIGNLWALAYIFRGNNAGLMWEATVRSYGHEPFSKDAMPQFNSDLAIEATQMLHDLVFRYQVASPGVIGYQYPELVEVVNNASAVLPFQWNASAPTNEDPERSKAAGQLAYAAFPYAKDAGPTVPRVRPNSHGLSVNPFSKNRDAALEFVFWYTSPEVARDYVLNGGGNSGRQSLLTDPEIAANQSWSPAMSKSFEFYHPYPQTRHYDFLLRDVLSKNLGEAWTGGLSVKEALDLAQEEAVDFLEQNA